MFFQRLLFHPAHGKLGELRSLVSDWVTANPMNLRVNLTQRIYGEGAPLSCTLIHDDLADVENHRDHGRVDQDFLAFRDTVISLTTAPEELQLLHVLASSGAASKPAKFVLRLHYYPILGKTGEMREALEEHAKAWESEGRSDFAIQRRILTPSSSGTEFVGTYLYQNMTEYENDSTNLPPSIINLVERITPILRVPIGHEFDQIVVPFSR